MWMGMLDPERMIVTASVAGAERENLTESSV